MELNVARWIDGTAQSPSSPKDRDGLKLVHTRATTERKTEPTPDCPCRIAIDDIIAALDATLEEKKRIRKAASSLLAKLEK